MSAITTSVVIPAYNAEVFVAEAIRSVLAQTRGDLELIVVDDGSQDNTAAVVETFDDPRLTLLRGPNRGVANARNRGLEKAQGRYIAFLDADDVWAPTKLERQIQVLQEADAAACGCFMSYLTPTGRSFGRTGISIDAQSLSLVAAGKLMPFPMSSILFKRDVIEAESGFDPELDIHIPGQVEDIDLLSRIARKHSVIACNEILGGYRLHPQAASARSLASQRLGVRFIEARRHAEAQGKTLTWEEFLATYRPTLRRRRLDIAATKYRQAGLFAVERRYLRAIASFAASAAVAPGYAIPRLVKQAPWRKGADIQT